MNKNKIREGKPNKSFKKVDLKANFDVTEHKGHGSSKPRPDRPSRHNPMMSPELRNELMRKFSKNV